MPQKQFQEIHQIKVEGINFLIQEKYYEATQKFQSVIFFLQEYQDNMTNEMRQLKADCAYNLYLCYLNSNAKTALSYINMSLRINQELKNQEKVSSDFDIYLALLVRTGDFDNLKTIVNNPGFNSEIFQLCKVIVSTLSGDFNQVRNSVSGLTKHKSIREGLKALDLNLDNTSKNILQI